MLEINRTYTKPELSQMLGTRSRQGIDRKLIRYGVGFEASGRGESAVYTIRLIRDSCIWIAKSVRSLWDLAKSR